MRQPDNEPLLFDLPLDRPARGDESGDAERQRQGSRREPAGTSQAAARQRQRTKQVDDAGPFQATPGARPGSGQGSAARPAAALPVPAGRSASAAAPATAMTAMTAGAPAPGEEESAARAGIGRRLASGAADLLVHAAVGVLALAGCRYLGVTPGVRDWPALAVFLLSFSFLYTVVPLAFWGHTLGMTWAGLSSQSREGEPLSFDQTTRRWLGMLLTLAALGLPLLLALTGRSLVDRMSDSSTFQAG